MEHLTGYRIQLIEECSAVWPESNDEETIKCIQIVVNREKQLSQTLQECQWWH